MTTSPIVTRFAPSPTGHLHIGGARTALFCWAFARHTGGRFMVRLEDTDVARSSESSAEGILRDLAWLGIEWDDGPELEVEGRIIGGDARGVAPWRQSERLDTYRTEVQKLIASGAAYAAFETTEEIEASRQAAVARKEQYRYDRAALAIPAEERARRVAAGEPHVIRFRTPDEAVEVEDVVLGTIRIEPEQLDDFVIIKRDGYPTYHFAVVV
ncbi:MAG: glutamate--tRNA ligase, partial [Phycisphaerales bacterium]|nr:glutamate--tRNA ligase [Phycisphaerales bacterium]